MASASANEAERRHLPPRRHLPSYEKLDGGRYGGRPEFLVEPPRPQLIDERRVMWMNVVITRSKSMRSKYARDEDVESTESM